MSDFDFSTRTKTFSCESIVELLYCGGNYSYYFINAKSSLHCVGKLHELHLFDGYIYFLEHFLLKLIDCNDQEIVPRSMAKDVEIFLLIHITRTL